MGPTGALAYVVDDDVSAREGVARLIRSAGVMTKTFASGEEFLASPRPKMPSCLVLDLNLPGLSGLDLQQELAQSGVQVPIIFLTGHGDISHYGSSSQSRGHKLSHETVRGRRPPERGPAMSQLGSGGTSPVR
jgi:FixJ family two-component response regulator